jgi:hypothetical protein
MPNRTSSGVARTGARKKPTLPPAAKTLIAPALSPAANRAARPAAGWNMATPSPDSRISVQTAGYHPPTSADSPNPRPASATPAAASQSSRYLSTSTPMNGCGIELPSAAARVRPEIAT